MYLQTGHLSYNIFAPGENNKQQQTKKNKKNPTLIFRMGFIVRQETTLVYLVIDVLYILVPTSSAIQTKIVLLIGRAGETLFRYSACCKTISFSDSRWRFTIYHESGKPHPKIVRESSNLCKIFAYHRILPSR
jgi:hypothetical protein